jgi:hypothetical protein
MSIKSLTFAALPKSSSTDPVVHRRNKLVTRLQHQISLANDPNFTLTRSKWVANSEGVKELREFKRRVKAWWRSDAAGNLILAVHYGAQKVELEKGKAGIVVGKKEKLIPTIETLIEAVSNGELDAVLASLSKTAIQTKGSKRAA